MKVTLEYLKDLYDERVEYVKRMIKNDPKSKPVWKSYLYGVYSITDKMMQQLLSDDIPRMTMLKKGEKKKAPVKDAEFSIELFGKTYYISVDDYGQCFTMHIDDKSYGLGTYNVVVEPDILYLVFRDIHEKNVTEIDLIK